MSEITATGTAPTAEPSGSNADSVTYRLRQEAEEYQQGHDQPLAGYATAMSVFAGAWAVGAAGVRASGRRPPESYRTSDLVVGAMAVHKLARIISKESVASPLRVPFTRFTGKADSAELQEEVRVSGKLRSLAELVTCPFCLAPWLASAYVGGLVTAPRAARTVAAVFAMVFGSDVLQQAYDKLKDA